MVGSSFFKHVSDCFFVLFGLKCTMHLFCWANFFLSFISVAKDVIVAVYIVYENVENHYSPVNENELIIPRMDSTFAMLHI